MQCIAQVKPNDYATACVLTSLKSVQQGRQMRVSKGPIALSVVKYLS